MDYGFGAIFVVQLMIKEIWILQLYDLDVTPVKPDKDDEFKITNKAYTGPGKYNLIFNGLV